jgi:hypothetical protein
MIMQFKNKSWLAAIVMSVSTMVFLSNCTKLDVTPPDRFTADKFFGNQQEAISGLASTYIGLRGQFDKYGNGGIYYIDESQSGNQAFPLRPGGGWGDGNGWHQRLYQQKVNYGDVYYNINTWNWLYQNIGLCNWYIDVISKKDLPGKDSLVAEARMNRALFHFWALSYFGNVPYVDTYEAAGTNAPEQQKQPYIYNKLVEEINACIPLLKENVTPSSAGRWSKWGAYAFLARLYLNAHIFKSESTDAASWKDPEWDKCIEACDKVITSAKYTLEPNYFTNFQVNNESSMENIFTIPYDENNGTGLYIGITSQHWNNGFFKYKNQSYGWGGIAITPDFFTSFDTTNDVRAKGGMDWGLQLQPDGTPVPSDDAGQPLVYKPTGFTLFSSTNYDGARIRKYQYAPTVFSMSNDFPLFRYADVLMMKAEALFRKGMTGPALTLVNDIRARASLAPLSTLTEQDLLLEMRHEFFAELRNRLDMRRFNQLSKGARWDHPAYPTNDLDILPIPQTALRANPKLKQNPGSFYASMQ